MKKLAIVNREDLDISEGKRISQAAHAAAMTQSNGHDKAVALSGSLDEIEKARRLSEDKPVEAKTVRDAGRTEVGSGTKTVLAIYGEEDEVDEITGDLDLW